MRRTLQKDETVRTLKISKLKLKRMIKDSKGKKSLRKQGSEIWHFRKDAIFRKLIHQKGSLLERITQ